MLHNLSLEKSGKVMDELSFSKVWTFGCNDEGSLGRPIEEEEDSFLPGEVKLISLINFSLKNAFRRILWSSNAT